MTAAAIAIRHGHLIDPSAGIDAAKDILLKDGRVAEIAAPGRLKLANGAQVIDATGLTIAPGLIDHRYRHRRRSRGGIHRRGRHAQHHPRQRFA